MKVAEEDSMAERILFSEQGQIGKSVALSKKILRAALMRKQDAITLAAAKTELTAIGWGQS